MEQLTSTYQARDDESSIIRSHVSEARKRAFLQSYLNDRARTATTETLFRSVNAFTLEPEFSNREAFGFNLLLLKAPFVEGSSWLPYSTLEFAFAAERHLLKRLERMLRESAADTQEQVGSSSWPDLLEGTRHLLGAAHARNYEPSLIVLAGRIPFDLLSRLYQYIGPEWGLDLGPRDMRILATYRGIPVLALEEADVPALYVADLARFGHLTRCGLEPEFSVEEIDDAQAEALLQSNPNIVEIPSDRPNTHDERVRQLKLHVRLRLFESYRLEVRDRNAVFAAALIGAAEPALQTAPP